MTDEEEKIQKEQQVKAFLADLRAVMVKHGVTEIMADDHWTGYAECGQDIRMTATIEGKHDGAEWVRHYVEVNLGSGFYAEE